MALARTAPVAPATALPHGGSGGAEADVPRLLLIVGNTVWAMSNGGLQRTTPALPLLRLVELECLAPAQGAKSYTLSRWHATLRMRSSAFQVHKMPRLSR